MCHTIVAATTGDTVKSNRCLHGVGATLVPIRLGHGTVQPSTPRARRRIELTNSMAAYRSVPDVLPQIKTSLVNTAISSAGVGVVISVAVAVAFRQHSRVISSSTDSSIFRRWLQHSTDYDKHRTREPLRPQVPPVATAKVTVCIYVRSQRLLCTVLFDRITETLRPAVPNNAVLAKVNNLTIGLVAGSYSLESDSFAQVATGSRITLQTLASVWTRIPPTDIAKGVRRDIIKLSK